ncbi:hypothetical protein D3C81_1197970 [compost metagenome]
MLRVAGRRLTEINRLGFHGAPPVLTPITVHRNIACGLVQIGPWLLHLRRIRLEHPHESVVGQVLGLLTISQATGPGANQLFVMLEKAVSAGQLGGHCGVL